MGKQVSHLPGLCQLPHRKFADQRGYLEILYTDADLYKHLGFLPRFVQETLSHSQQHVLRGLHYQWPTAQDKLIRVLKGTILDVIVDLRPHLPSFGHYVCRTMTVEDGYSLWIPKGCAHGFYTCSTHATILYHVTAAFTPEEAHVLSWQDPELNIPWPPYPGYQPCLSLQDQAGESWLSTRTKLTQSMSDYKNVQP